MALTSCCPICYRIGPLSKVNCESLKKRELVQQRFFKFFKRYLNDGNDEEESNVDKKRKQLHGRGYPKLEKLSEDGLLPCQDCLSQMESFCDLYDKLKATELLLNWKVWTVKNIMTGAQRVSSRIKAFREFIENIEVEAGVGGHGWGSGNEIINFVGKSRKTLIGKCSRKVENATPILSIGKWEPGGEQISTTCLIEDEEILREVESTSANSISVIRATSVMQEAKTANIGEKTVESSRLMSMAPSPAGASRDGHDDANHEDSSVFSIDHSEPFPNDEVDNRQSLGNMFINIVTEESSEANGTSKCVDHFPNSVKVEADAEFIGESIPEPSTASEMHLNKAPSLNTKRYEGIHRPLPALEPVFDHASNKTDSNIISEESPQSGLDEAEDYSQVGPEMITEATPTISTLDETQNSEPRTQEPDQEPIQNSRLRPTHKCVKCGRTFSNVERLQSHEQEAHGHDADNFSDIESMLSEDEHRYTDNINDGSPPLSSSSSLSDESDSDFEFLQNTEEELQEEAGIDIKPPIITTTDPLPQIIFDVEEDRLNYPCVERKQCKRKEIVKHSHFRLKCPDCNSIFQDVKGLLFHRKLSLTCDPSYDPKLKINVDVLVPTSKCKSSITTHVGDDSKFSSSVVFARIALPQEIFSCEKCDLAVYSSEDMETHTKLHGTFPCKFCDVKEDYAPNLACHELKHVASEGNNAPTQGNCPTICCSRCNYRVWQRKRYIAHHLITHLGLVMDRLKCAICKTSGRWKTTRELATHFKTHHDLTGISNPKDLYACPDQSCGAYFLLKSQLSNHKMFHKASGNFRERRAQNTPIWRGKCKAKSGIKNELVPPDETIIIETETREEFKPEPRQQNIQTGELSETKTAAKLPTNSTTDSSSQTTLDVCNTQKLNPNIKEKKSNQNDPGKYPPFRLKCPDCHALFEDVQGILTHRKFSATCGPLYNPKLKINVDVLVPPSKSGKDDDDNDGSICSVVFAKISLPQEIFLCDKCQLAVYSSEDMEAHNKLHGTFPCQFCSTKEDYAPDLSLHELEHAVTEGKEIKTNGNQPIFYCARCDYGVGNSRERYIIHHLKAHLGLIMNRPKCAICKRNGHSVTNRTLINHFKTHHDLTGTSSVKGLCKCPEQHCGAYFLQKLQLNNHMKLRHHVSGNVWGRRAKNSGRRKPKCKLKVPLLKNDNDSGSHVNKLMESRTLEESKSESRQQNVSSSDLEKDVDLQPISGNENKKTVNQAPCMKPGSSRDLGRNFRLKCPDCNHLFRDVKSLLLHRRDSQSCSETYDPNASIKVEMVVPSPGVKRKETTVSYRIPDKYLFAVIDLPQRMFRCEDCDLQFYSSESLEAHKSLHGKFKCNFCPMELTYAKNLAIHELQHFSENGKRPKLEDECKSIASVKCPRCELSLKNKSQYARHYLSLHMSLKWIDVPLCAICKTTKTTLRTKDLGEHFRASHDLSQISDQREIVRCQISECDAYFLTRGQLSGHLRYHHNYKTGKNHKGPDSNLRFNCKDCDKSYADSNALRMHRLKHHVPLDKVLPCPFKKCNLVYETRQQLELHLTCSKERHKALDKPANKKFVNCPVCNKRVSSSRSSFLKIHMRSHDTSNVCELCGMLFNTKYKLEVHKLAHSGPESWQFSCSVCGKKCLTGGKLNEHLRTHTKETPYVCEICGQKYAHRHNLRIHVNNKHGDEVQDIPRKISTKNFASKKGIKRKKIESESLHEDDVSNDDE